MNYRKETIKTLEGLGHRHSTWQVFQDWVAMYAYSLSNALDKIQFQEREEKYLDIAKRYDQEEMQKFCQCAAYLVQSFENEVCDHLGEIFMEMELGNKWQGQFFTPYDVCRMMAGMTITDNALAMIDDKGFISCSEPACGAGAMILGVGEYIKERGYNPQQQTHWIATDVDPKAVHMTYIQLSLTGIPAIVVHGNTLTLEEFGHWYTPQHILGNWVSKLAHKVPSGDRLTPSNPTAISEQLELL